MRMIKVFLELNSLASTILVAAEGKILRDDLQGMAV